MAQATCITTAIRELMSREGPAKSTSPVGAAHIELVAALAGNPPLPIRIQVDSHDLEARAEHLDRLFAALGVYFSAILADTDQNIPGGKLDRKYLEAVYTDLAAEAAGGIRMAAEEMREHETRRAS